MRRRAPFDLMVIVDPRIGGVLDGLARLSEATGGERIAIQLRAKDASDAELISLARHVAAVQPAMSRLLVNGRVEVARAIAADGVHLPESGVQVRDVRASMPDGALVGASCHDERSVRDRESEDCDYVLLGPLGEVPDKPAMRDEDFAQIARAANVPVLALGGIDSELAAARAITLGAAGIAVQRALLDPHGAAWMARWLAGRIAE